MKHNHVDNRKMSWAVRVKNSDEGGTVFKNILNQFHKAPRTVL
jgi:hypothetical protein